jgi:hypothetical protein
MDETHLIYLQHGNSIGMAPIHFVLVVVSAGRLQHMSDIYVTCQFQDKLMHKVTNCARLKCSSLFLRQSELQYINSVIGWKYLYEKVIEGPKFGQNGYINREIKKIRLKQKLKLPKPCVQRRDIW